MLMPSNNGGMIQVLATQNKFNSVSFDSSNGVEVKEFTRVFDDDTTVVAMVARGRPVRYRLIKDDSENPTYTDNLDISNSCVLPADVPIYEGVYGYKRIVFSPDNGEATSAYVTIDERN